jgi:hypothetical protein
MTCPFSGKKVVSSSEDAGQNCGFKRGVTSNLAWKTGAFPSEHGRFLFLIKQKDTARKGRHRHLIHGSYDSARSILYR